MSATTGYVRRTCRVYILTLSVPNEIFRFEAHKKKALTDNSYDNSKLILISSEIGSVVW